MNLVPTFCNGFPPIFLCNPGNHNNPSLHFHCRTMISTSFASSRRGLRRFMSTVQQQAPQVSVEYRDHIAILTLNRPKEMNALTESMGDEFTARVRELTVAAEEQRIRAVVLRGEGKSFSAGGDLAWLKERSQAGGFSNSITMNKFYRRFLCIRDIPVPTIAAIHGFAIGAGCCLTLACDMRVVAKSSTLGFTFTKLGIHPGMGSSLLLPRIVSSDFANYLLLGGQTVTGEVAAQRGLALESVEDDKLLTRAIEIATVVANNSPIAVQSSVRTLRHQKFDGLDAALQREADSQSICYSSSDYLLGISGIINESCVEYT